MSGKSPLVASAEQRDQLVPVMARAIVGEAGIGRLVPRHKLPRLAAFHRLRA